MKRSPNSLYQELLELDEHQRIEAKRATEIGKSVMQTVCAFANEPGLGGGYLLLGIREPNEENESYWIEGVQEPDKLIDQLQNNCRNQFEQPITIESERARIDGKLVISVFVPELQANAKPCRFVGKPDRSNKRKTGVWRRGLNGDYECSEKELEPLLLAKAGLSAETIIREDADWNDLDPGAINLYRQLRAKVRPEAEELQESDEEMLRAMNLVQGSQQGYRPNLAGILLFGKPIALRRLLPVARVDYVRIQGTKWVEDPDARFATTQDFREPLIRLIPKLEATILDDMPRHFQLKEGDTQRSDRPLLPHKVIREAVVNAVMHRDYLANQPTLVVRYSNRLEIRNAGYSLKPEPMLGEMGSNLRNPIIAAVLYDIDFAETKGTGIRTMRRLLEQAGLDAPVFTTSYPNNDFTATYLLHQLLGEEQLKWLERFVALNLSNSEVKALVLAKETGAVDNAALRSISGLDTLTASQALRRLSKNLGLLEKGGSGPATYYSLTQNAGELPANTSDLSSNTGEFGPNTSDLEANTSEFQTNTSEFSPDLLQRAAELSPKARKNSLWPVLLGLCAERPVTAEQLASLTQRKVVHLKNSHLSPLRRQHGLLSYLYPEVENHPNQAYITTEKGKAWLRKGSAEQ